MRLALLDSLALLVQQVVPRTPNEHYGTRMFWDVIGIRARPFDLAALPALASLKDFGSPGVADALFQVLARQLRMPDKQLQLGALQGLRQLGDTRTHDLIDSAWALLVDKEVRQTAVRAARFDLI